MYHKSLDMLPDSVEIIMLPNNLITAIENCIQSAISNPRTYRIDYISDGTNCYCTASENLG